MFVKGRKNNIVDFTIRAMYNQIMGETGKNATVINNSSKAYWLSFAISRFAKSKKLTPDFVFPKLREYGVLDFLNTHYETEHLENIIYVIEDMNNILERNGGSLE